MKKNQITAPPAPSAHLNILGINEGYGELDYFERMARYAETLTKYPITVKSNCTTIRIQIEQCSADLERVTKLRASGTVTDRVIAREQAAYETRLAELKQYQSKLRCSETEAEKQSQQFFDTQYDQLKKIKGLSDSQSSGATWLIYGMIGLMVLVSGIIIYRKTIKRNPDA